MRQCGKLFRTGQATDDNMAPAYCMLGTQGYKHTLRMCNTYCISTTTMVAPTRLSVRAHVHLNFSFLQHLCISSQIFS